jgi:hypothetical protein
METMFMPRNPILIFCFLLSAALAISIPSAAPADERKGLESHISIGMGWEQLDYEEHEPEGCLNSNAKAGNATVWIEGLKRWKSLFGGIKAVIPVLREDDTETWVSSDGAAFQTNSLEYEWMRIDGYLGYPATCFFNPYIGLRWSESKQDRADFLVNNAAVAGTARETVRSWSLLLGFRGNGSFTPRWGWNYWMECFVPIDVQVTNNTLPGFEASGKDGYTVELKCGTEYRLSEALSIGILIYGGRMHWGGSGWKSCACGTAKWPENDTDYLGGALNIVWRFDKRGSK